MISFIIDKFQEHPSEVGETYWQHFCHAFSFAACLLLAAGACLIHAILPFCCTTTGSSAVKKLYSNMVTNRSKVSVEDLQNKDIVQDGATP